MANYYNEIDAYAAEWLRNLMKERLIPDGEVDTRSIVDVEPRDLAGFTQCHFFAGIAGWSHALRLAGWSEDRPIWTGSCPCQPFSVAGKGKGTADERHLWPVFFDLIRECRPSVVMGEQVAGKAGYAWFDGVAADLEEEDYACRAVDIPACAVDAPHIRQRLYWCAVADAARLAQREPHDDISAVARQDTRDGVGGSGCGYAPRDMADADEPRLERRRPAAERAAEQPSGPDGVANADSAPRRQIAGSASCDEEAHGGAGRNWREQNSDYGHTGDGEGIRRNGSVWSDAIWRTGADGKARRAQPSVRLLAHGVPNRVGRLRGFGNAIVPPLAAEVIKAFMDA